MLARVQMFDPEKGTWTTIDLRKISLMSVQKLQFYITPFFLNAADYFLILSTIPFFHVFINNIDGENYQQISDFCCPKFLCN